MHVLKSLNNTSSKAYRSIFSLFADNIFNLMLEFVIYSFLSKQRFKLLFKFMRYIKIENFEEKEIFYSLHQTTTHNIETDSTTDDTTEHLLL